MTNRITPGPGVAVALAKARAEAQGLDADRVSKREREARDLELIGLIADRLGFTRFADSKGRQNWVILFIQVKKANPGLDLETLLNSEWEDFQHDIQGIYHHVKHPTGVLGNQFLPRAMRG